MSKPLLVYNRIAANRRRTRVLLALFAAAMLPFASGATLWVAMPLLFTIGLFALVLVPGLAAAMDGASLQQAVLVEAGLYGSALILATIALAVVTTAFIYRYSSTMILRAAQAQPVDRQDQVRLHRIVEQLCVGAGLPKPRLYLIESSTPNAFATGRKPEHAALIVTRGLLTLLDRRELEGVVAHELSHIGNQDIRLSTTLAGLVGTLTMPLTIILAVLRLHPVIAVLAAVMALPLVSSFLMAGWFGLTEGPTLFSEATGQAVPPIFWWWGLHAFATPFYMVFVAPLVGRLLKRGVLREREFLADADAVAVTRNPESLALALIKVASAHGTPIRVGPATRHLYFVDPIRAGGPWLAAWFRSHPPVSNRLDLLFRMGSGIAPTTLDEAIRTGTEPHEVHEPGPSVPLKARSWWGSHRQEGLHAALVLLWVMVAIFVWRGPFGPAELLLFLFGGLTIWYYWRQRHALGAANVRPDGGTVLSDPLAAESRLSPRIREDGAQGQPGPTDVTSAPASLLSAALVSDAGPTILAEEAPLGRRVRLAERMTLLYAQPDGWSPVVERLLQGTAVTLEGWDRGFVKVRTDHGSVGYLGRRTRLHAEGDR